MDYHVVKMIVVVVMIVAWNVGQKQGHCILPFHEEMVKVMCVERDLDLVGVPEPGLPVDTTEIALK